MPRADLQTLLDDDLGKLAALRWGATYDTEALKRIMEHWEKTQMRYG
jgi:hypothetical protein